MKTGKALKLLAAVGLASFTAVSAGCGMFSSSAKTDTQRENRRDTARAEVEQFPEPRPVGRTDDPWAGDDLDPFVMAAIADAERAAGIGGTALRPTETTPRRRQAAEASEVDAAMNLYGDAVAGRAVSSLNEAAILDGMESLIQVTYASEGAAFDPNVSRDGRFVVFASTQHRPTANIYIKPINGRTVTQLTADPAHDVMPAVSPDGKRIAFTSNRAGTWDIYVMSIEGGQAVQLTSGPTHDLHPTWSPDGRYLAYCRLGQMSGRWELWVLDVEQPTVAEFIGYGLFPQWCPVAGTGEQGRDKIVYQRSRERGDRAFSIWTIEYKRGDASSPTEIASHAERALINPTWSPDGNWVVFASVPKPESDGEGRASRPVASDLWMVGVGSAGKVNLTGGRYVNLMPAWGPDGRIYFVSNRSGVDNIWSIGTEKSIMAATGQRGGVATVPTQ